MASKHEWLKPRVEKLVEIAKPIKSICPNVVYEVGAWSIIKLLTLLRFVPIYTRIIKAPKQRRIFQNMYYIDLLAGSGLCRIKPTKDIIIGSALIACTQCQNPFDKYFLVEQDLEKARALEARIASITSAFKLFPCDCNDCIQDIMREITDRDHYLAFVDCEGLDVFWSTMQQLFSKKGDVLFNFQTQGISRLLGRVKNRSSGWKKYAERLSLFFGDDRWENCMTPDSLLKCYMDKISDETTRELVLPLPVKGEGGYRYDIILATRKTRGENPWIVPMKELQNIMGGYKPEIIKEILDILMKRQLSLNNSYLKPSED